MTLMELILCANINININGGMIAKFGAIQLQEAVTYIEAGKQLNDEIEVKNEV